MCKDSYCKPKCCPGKYNYISPYYGGYGLYNGYGRYGGYGYSSLYRDDYLSYGDDYLGYGDRYLGRYGGLYAGAYRYL
jgi:hypothetical protein